MGDLLAERFTVVAAAVAVVTDLTQFFFFNKYIYIYMWLCKLSEIIVYRHSRCVVSRGHENEGKKSQKSEEEEEETEEEENCTLLFCLSAQMHI